MKQCFHGAGYTKLSISDGAGDVIAVLFELQHLLRAAPEGHCQMLLLIFILISDSM